MNLQRNGKGFLNMWAPSKRGDSHFNYVVFHPYCSNFYALELEHTIAADPSVSVTEKPSF